MDSPFVTIYTDGGCSPNPGPGGWAAVILSGDARPREIHGSEEQTTNNRMELQAAIQGLQALQGHHRVRVCTDSQYLRTGITSWLHRWQRQNWQTRDGFPVKNQDLWQLLGQLVETHDVEWRWVKGHSRDRWNERADELASRFRQRQELPLADQHRVHVFTGVTCSHSTGLGSWAVMLKYRNHIKILGTGVSQSTANSLYIQSVIEALQALTKPVPVHVYTSSGYLRDGAALWRSGWRRRNWQTKDGRPVSNRENWQRLDRLLTGLDVQFHLVDKKRPLCRMQEIKEIARGYAAYLKEAGEDRETLHEESNA